MYMFCSLERHIPRNIFPGTEFSELDAIGEEAKGCLRHQCFLILNCLRRDSGCCGVINRQLLVYK
jgi:hypothetical protein